MTTEGLRKASGTFLYEGISLSEVLEKPALVLFFAGDRAGQSGPQIEPGRPLKQFQQLCPPRFLPGNDSRSGLYWTSQARCDSTAYLSVMLVTTVWVGFLAATAIGKFLDGLTHSSGPRFGPVG